MYIDWECKAVNKVVRYNLPPLAFRGRSNAHMELREYARMAHQQYHSSANLATGRTRAHQVMMSAWQLR